MDCRTNKSPTHGEQNRATLQNDWQSATHFQDWIVKISLISSLYFYHLYSLRSALRREQKALDLAVEKPGGENTFLLVVEASLRVLLALSSLSLAVCWLGLHLVTLFDI